MNNISNTKDFYFHCPLSALLFPYHLQAYRQSPPYFPINEYWLLFAIIGGTLGVGVSLAVGILFAVQVSQLRGSVYVCVCVRVCIHERRVTVKDEYSTRQCFVLADTCTYVAGIITLCTQMYTRAFTVL